MLYGVLMVFTLDIANILPKFEFPLPGWKSYANPWVERFRGGYTAGNIFVDF